MESRDSGEEAFAGQGAAAAEAAQTSSRGRGRGRGGGGPPSKRHNPGSLAPLPENASPVQKAFYAYSQQLTAKHDKYESLVKKSRDVTINSKRAIFVLHRITATSTEEHVVEAGEKLTEVHALLSAIAAELQNEDPAQFWRAFSPGVQEYVEAALFYVYNTERRVATLEELNHQLKNDAGGPCFEIAPPDYMLGLADLTGELMRMAINNLGDPEEKIPFEILELLRTIHEGFRCLSPNVINRDMAFKLNVMASSVAKVEDACYMLKVRGTEIPKDQIHRVLQAQDDGDPNEYRHDAGGGE